MRAAVRAARQARWREAARGAAARLLALHTRRPALRRRVAAAAARLRAQEGTPVLLELPPLPPIDLVGLEEGNPVAAEARDAADYEAVCELAATWRTEQSEEAAAAAEEELAFAQACAWYVHVYAWHMHGICTVYARYMHGICMAFAQDRRKWNAEEHAWLREMAPWRVELAALTLALIPTLTLPLTLALTTNPNQVELAAQAPPPSAVELRAQRATLQA